LIFCSCLYNDLHDIAVLEIHQFFYLAEIYVAYGIWIKSPRKKSTEKIPLNAVEREPVPTRVLNPNASEVKQRSYRKTKLKFFFSVGFYPGTVAYI